MSKYKKDWQEARERMIAWWAGKKGLIYCAPERVRPLLNKITRDHMFMSVDCKDEPTARGVLRDLEKIGV